MTLTDTQTDVIGMAHYGFGTGRFMRSSNLYPVAVELAGEGYLYADGGCSEVATFRMTPKGKRLGGKLFGQVSVRGLHRSR
jgi:hypothetical protein